MKIAHERRGSGEPLVLVHGIGSRKEAWTPAVEPILDRREVWSVDMPGFGESSDHEAAATIPEAAELLAGFFDEQKLERPHVAGNSMGGGIALELGRLGAVRSLTLFSPVGFQDAVSQLWETALLSSAYRLSQLNPPGGPRGWRLPAARAGSFMVSFGRPFSVPAEEIRAANVSLMEADGFLDALPTVRAYRFGDAEQLRELPMTIAWGRRDVLLNYWIQSRRARRRLPWARHVTLARCGHVPFFDAPEACARVLIEGSGG